MIKLIIIIVSDNCTGSSTAAEAADGEKVEISYCIGRITEHN